MSKENRALELKNKRICRFCLTQNEPLSNIYSMENRLKCSAPLPLQIMSCVSIEVFSNDEMPYTICEDCRTWMEHCYRFKQMCKKSDNLLRQYTLIGMWPQPLEIPKLSKEIILKMYPEFCQAKKNTASTQTDKDDKITAKTYNLPKSKPPKSAPVVINSNRQLLAAISQHKLAARQKQQKPAPRLLNKNSVKILNKIAQKNPEPILSHPRVTRDSAGNVEITTEILEQIPNEEIDPIKNVAPVETNVFPCPHCERSFPLRQLLDIHMVNHNRKRSFKCNICSKSFFSKYDLGKHMLIHTGEKPFECVVCKKAFTRSTLLHRHEKIHTDQPRYLCVYCEKAFLSKEEMDKHTERHRKHRPFVCKICNKAFAFKQGLERHETIHAKDQPYPCQYCDCSFSTSSKLARHLTAHAGDRPYPCKLCPKSYLLSHHLTRHLRSHKQGSGSYKCFDCEKVFTTRDDLIYHSAVHATQTLICPLCKESFENLDSVTEHIRNHAEGEQYACEFCDLIFMTAEKLQNHSDTEHVDDLAVYEEHDKNVKNEAQQFTEDSQESTNNNDEIFEEFIIEEYEQEDDDQQQNAIDEPNIKKENDVMKKNIYNTNENDDDNTKQPAFEEYNEEIGMEIQSLIDESEEFVLEESTDESPPQKIIKLTPKENQKMTYNMETHKIREIASTSSSNQQGQKVPEGKKQEQQQQQQPKLKTYSSRQSAMKQMPRFAVVTKTIYPVSDKFKEMPSTSSSPLQEQESSNKRSTHVLNSMKISPLNKIEAKKPAINLQDKIIKKQQSEVNIKTEKNSKMNSSTNSNIIKEYSVISQNEKNNGNSSNASENKEQRSSDSSVLKDSSSTSDNSKNFNNKNLVEMVIGDRKVKVQKIVMTKAQVEIMTKEGKIEVKDGAMIIKNKNSDAISDSNNDNSSRKIITRSKQSILNKK